MATARQKNAALKKVYTYFNGIGKVLTEKEYKESDGPIRFLVIKKLFNGYRGMISSLKRNYPEWELWNPKEEVKPDPLAELANKVSDFEENLNDEQDI